MDKSARGLSLAETLVSLTLLTLLMVAVLNLFPSSMSVVGNTRTSELARALAQNRIEALAAQPFASLEVNYEARESTQLSNGQAVEILTTVSAVDGHNPERLKRVRCEATWKGQSKERTEIQEFYVTSIRR